ncbi:MAG: 4-hydroxybenzoate 3-monooxygenase [Bryobacteraceae bacterium]
MRTQVGIVGAGPAGLVLARLLHLAGIESIVVEARSRKHVEERVRAGVLEQGSADLMAEIGAGERMKSLALEHRGIELRFNRQPHRIDLHELTGRSIFIYGQNKVVQDLTDLNLSQGGQIFFEAEAAAIEDLDTVRPSIRMSMGGEERKIVCDFIAGCDGFHGISRAAIPAASKEEYERIYPFAWLGILSEMPPPCDELIYSHSPRGFALVSMRGRGRTRLYLQCEPDEDIANWPDGRIWDELRARLATADGAFELNSGPVIQKGITGMRSFVVEPMQFGNMFLAGDAAHIVPPTGAKGMNLALADTVVLARALAEYYRSKDRSLLNRYSETCLKRVWRTQRFSWWMTSMLHSFGRENEDGASRFDRRRQIAELEYVVGSRAAATSLAENYAGLPIA